MSRHKTRKRASKQVKSRQKRPFFAYPLFIFLLLCAGIFLIAWTIRAGADSVFVTAKVSAPFVSQPATITTPDDGTHFSATPIDVKGDCPANAGYVEIFNNGVMSGSAICQVDNTFEISVNLQPGDNSLIAHVFNTTDDEGPVSGAVNVVYDVPQPPVPPVTNPTGQGTPTTPQPSANPFLLNTAFVYKGFHVGEQIKWPLSISGGTAPYAVNVDWGDGNSDLISRSEAGQFDINHTYGQPGGYKNSYTIKIKATDNQGRSAYIQFFVIITPQEIGQSGGTIFSKPTPRLGGLNWLWVAWPLYAIVVLMAVSYRLGEQEELLILRKKGMLKR
jgi:hypothetical protein